MNNKITCQKSEQKTFGNNIRNHHAKQFASIDGMLGHLRGIYDSPELSSYPNQQFNTSYKLWNEVRNRIDEEGLFLNPYIKQFFISEGSTYQKERGYEVSEGGNVSSHHCVIL